MRASAAAQFYADMKELEGVLYHLYFDTKNLATTGIGNMIDTGMGLTPFGLALPWRKKDGSYATEAEVAAEYKRLKALGIASQGGRAYAKYATLFLDADVVEWLFQTKAASMEANVAKYLPNWALLPADAQAAVMSMVWNVGENMLNPTSPKVWPNLRAALLAEDFIKAADNCMINGTTSERNRRNRKMFLQAATVKQFGVSPDRLNGPDIRIYSTLIPTGDKPRGHAFYTQYLLRVAGTYTAKVDGLFGALSLAAWTKATGEKTINLTGLQKLVKLTASTVGAEAVA